jgi:hypothetical protein
MAGIICGLVLIGIAAAAVAFFAASGRNLMNAIDEPDTVPLNAARQREYGQSVMRAQLKSAVSLLVFLAVIGGSIAYLYVMGVR